MGRAAHVEMRGTITHHDVGGYWCSTLFRPDSSFARGKIPSH